MVIGLQRFGVRFKQGFVRLWFAEMGVRRLAIACLTIGLVVMMGIGFPGAQAGASIDDDRFDGNIFALYAGNGSLVPPHVTLAQSLKNSERPTLLTFYIEDSKDCKQFSSVISELQAYYGRVLDFIPINVDAIPVQASYTPDEPGYYYSGKVPQTVLFDLSGNKVVEGVGKSGYEPFDDALRQMFDLLPRDESITLKRRPINEVNSELIK